MRATISLLPSGFEEEGVTFWLSARARVPAGGQSPLWVKLPHGAKTASCPFLHR